MASLLSKFFVLSLFLVCGISSLQNLSTSPHCEPPYFASTTRATFLHILTHPQPLITVFPEGKPRVYQLSDSEKNWTQTS